MTDEQIIRQLISGNHLEKKELERAKDLIRIMKYEVNSRKQLYKNR